MKEYVNQAQPKPTTESQEHVHTVDIKKYVRTSTHSRDIQMFLWDQL